MLLVTFVKKIESAKEKGSTKFLPLASKKCFFIGENEKKERNCLGDFQQQFKVFFQFNDFHDKQTERWKEKNKFDFSRVLFLGSDDADCKRKTQGGRTPGGKLKT